MPEIAPGVHIASSAKRVLYDGDPKADDYVAMAAEVAQIRSELSSLRHRLRAVGRRETHFEFDSIAIDAVGALSCAIVTLHQLVDGDRSLTTRAEHARELWADVEAHPADYIVKAGTMKEAQRR